MVLHRPVELAPLIGNFMAYHPGDAPITRHSWTCHSRMACVSGLFYLSFVRISAVYAGSRPERQLYSAQFGALSHSHS